VELTILTIATLWMTLAAHAAEPRPPAVTLLITPGLAPSSFSTLRRKLDRRRSPVQLVPVPCPSGDREDTIRFLQQLNVDETVVVVHGMGVAWALEAGLAPTGWVWLAPVLDIWPVNQDLPEEFALRRTTYVSQAYSACSSPAFNESLRALADGQSPADLRQQVSAPVVALISASDDIATVEASLPILLTTPLVSIRRLGVGGWGHRDLDHTELITSRRGQRQVRRALRLLRRQQ
jgi:pimeloyl-ACP methyl ester carboxylesterase